MEVKVIKTMLSDSSPVYDLEIQVGTKRLVLNCEDQISAENLAEAFVKSVVGMEVRS